MPFTFSHPAIVLPFLKNDKLSASAMIVGSMSPDFEYFFRMERGELGHTFVGIFLVDLPLGLVVIFAFHEIMKTAFIENSPVFFQRRLQVLKKFDWFQYSKNNVLAVLFSFFLGAVSHFLWDSFTHSDGFFVERFAFFYIEIGYFPIYVYAQYICSLIGLISIAFYCYQLPKSDTISNPINWNYWRLVVFLSVVFIAIRFYFGSELGDIGNFTVSVLSPIIIAFTITGLVFRNKTLI